MLIQLGANVDHKTANGKTAIHFAAEAGNSNNKINKLFQTSKCDVIFIRADYKEIVSMLIKSGADRSVRSNDGKLPKDRAPLNGNLQNIQRTLAI